MKKLLIVLLWLITINVFSQTPLKTIRVINATTQFGVNFSDGTMVYDMTSEKLWLAIEGVISTSTLTTASSSFNLIFSGSFTETDPIFTAHVASGITSFQISAWSTAYGWGNHGLVGYIETETDPIYSADPASSITTTNLTNWNSAYGWGNHSIEGYITNQDLAINRIPKWDGEDLVPSNIIEIGTNIGIGSTNPQNVLDINGTVEMTGFKMVTLKNNGYVLTSDINGVGTWQEVAACGNVSNTGTPVNNQIATWTNTTTIEGSNNFVFDGTNVGIGLTDPKNKLDVEGAAVIGTAYSGTHTAPENGLLIEGNVGIGVTNPTEKLCVNGKLVVSGNSIIADGWIYAKSYLKSDGFVWGKIVQAIDSDGLKLYEDGGSGIFIKDGGNVGINSTSPTALLDIGGSINFSETNVGDLTTYTITANDCIIHFTGKYAISMTLPDETPCPGRWYMFCNDGSDTMTIKDNDGSTVIKIVTVGNSGSVISLGSKWWAWY